MQGRSEASGAAGRRDADWARHIGAEVRRSEVRLSAILDERRVTLADVAAWKVGQVLSLRAGPESRVRLVCNDTTILACDLGQADGAYTLRVAEIVEEPELIDVLLAG
jgi:flagellar motor switch protein FliM